MRSHPEVLTDGSGLASVNCSFRHSARLAKIAITLHGKNDKEKEDLGVKMQINDLQLHIRERNVALDLTVREYCELYITK